jgi:carbon storage regulator
MLVLTRKINECILIDSTIEVRVLRTQGNKVTIGLSAPRDIPICRGELQPRIKDATEDYAQVSCS